MQGLTDIRNLHAVLLLSAVFMAAGCDNGANPPASMGPPTVLAFHICVRPDEVTDIEPLRARLDNEGEINSDDDEMIWLSLGRLAGWVDSDEDRELMTNDPEAFFADLHMVGTLHGGNYYVLLWNTADQSLGPYQEWSIFNASRTRDQLGFPAISFDLDTRGGDLMQQMTANNVHRQMAIVLNGKIHSAPTIQAAISRNGIITGGPSGFTDTEVSELVRQLNNASLVPREPGDQ